MAKFTNIFSRYPTKYRVSPSGAVETLTLHGDGNENDRRDYDKAKKDFPYTNLFDAQNALAKQQQTNIKNLQDTYEKRLADVTSQENARNSLAQQIAALTGGGSNQPSQTLYAGGTPNFNEATGKYVNQTAVPAALSSSALDAISGGISQLALAQNPAITALSAGNNYATSPLANKLNFQVSDQQILDDYNNTKLGRLNSIVQQGNTQVAGIQQRLTAAQTLLDQLPKNDPRYTSSKVYVDQLNADLKSVTDAITGANTQIKEFNPIAVGTPEAASQITSFREYLQLPEERATQQLRQIDPDSYKTAVDLGRRYREMANAPIGQTQNAQTEAFRAELEKGYRDYSASAIGATTTPETEALRRRIEDEAMSQLSLGAQLGAEEQRQYQQAARAAQTARGNIFGVAPAVEEAVTTGAAGEQRKLARYGAASQFLSSGQTTGDALARDVQLRNALQQSKLGAGAQFMASGQTASDALKADLAFRDALLQSRLGAASGFIAGGPSLYNLGQARTGAQQSAFQNYIQANQALPGQFGQAPSTAQPFYQAVDQSIPVSLTNTFANLYGSQANYLASTYGAQVGAISRQPTGAQQFADIAGGVGGLLGKVAPFGVICWVAREVYGNDNPKWLQFREWMLTKASDNLRNFYIKHGEKIAESIRNKPKIKSIIRKWMDGKITELNGAI